MIKSPMDEAYKIFKSEDWSGLNAAKKSKYISQMEKAQKNLEQLLYQHKFFDTVKKLGVMKRSKMRRLKYDDGLYAELRNKIDFINDTYKAVPDIIKKMKMSDAQRKATVATSNRMRAKWGE